MKAEDSKHSKSTRYKGEEYITIEQKIKSIYSKDSKIVSRNSFHLVKSDLFAVFLKDSEV